VLVVQGMPSDHSRLTAEMLASPLVGRVGPGEGCSRLLVLVPHGAVFASAALGDLD
jgi:hypothetical protein